MMVSQLQTVATKLGVADATKQKLVDLRNDSWPRFHQLIDAEQTGKKLTDEQREAIHKEVTNIRISFHKAVYSALTENQGRQLTAWLKQCPGLARLLPEVSSLSFVFLGAAMAHFAQPDTLDTLSTKLGLSATQKEQFRKVGAELDEKLQKYDVGLRAMFREERQAMTAVLTDAQKAKWDAMSKSKGRDNTQSPPDPFSIEKLMSDLGLADAQKEMVRGIDRDYATKIATATTALWDEYHRQQLALEKLLCDQQRQALPAVLKAMRDQDTQTLATKLGLSDDAKQRLAQLRAQYEPKLATLIAPTLKGEKVGKKEWLANHQKVAQLRLALLAAVSSVLTENQRARLPAILREFPGLPHYVREDASCALLLLSAELCHFAQPEYLDTVATKLDLSAAQKAQFQKAQAQGLSEFNKLGAALTELVRAEREAVAKVLSDDQRAKWKEIRKAGGEQ
jgi:hypothetical protein